MKITRGLPLSLVAIPTPIPAPIRLLAILEMAVRVAAKAFSPHQDAICARIVPAISVQKSPCAIPEKASINHLFEK